MGIVPAVMRSWGFCMNAGNIAWMSLQPGCTGCVTGLCKVHRFPVAAAALCDGDTAYRFAIDSSVN